MYRVVGDKDYSELYEIFDKEISMTWIEDEAIHNYRKHISNVVNKMEEKGWELVTMDLGMMIFRKVE